ncbi:hypothetical protein DXG01_005786 [Tephrocybe rancida]|nr:hypothetical protein DXG01_005786 [Tephrocybe rancida]
MSFEFSPDPTYHFRCHLVLEHGGEFDTAVDDPLLLRDLAIQYLLHSAVISMRGQQVKDTVYRYFRLDPSSIHLTDAYGLTPVHIAFGRANPDAVAALLALGGASELSNAHNKGGMTPLQYLVRDMQLSRRFHETTLGQWGGYADDQLICEFLARRTLNSSSTTCNLKEFIAQRKWGCTCGICAGGWLSKRMRFQLKVQAGFCIDMMMSEKWVFKDDEVIDDPMDLMDLSTSYIPEHLYPSFNKTFYEGFQSVFVMTELLLEKRKEAFTKDVVARLIAGRDKVRFFLDEGGKVEHVLDAITDLAKGESSLGDGEFEETFGEDAEYVKLPTCDNDLALGLVRRMLGL